MITFYREEYIGPGIAMFLLVLMTYLAGRVHQFYKQTTEREQAFREGYHLATKALFSLATRVAKGPDADKAKPAPTPKMLRGYASVPADQRHPLPARHRAEGRRKPNLADTKKFDDWQVRRAA